MKFGQTSINLFILAVIFAATAFYFEKTAVQIRVDGEIEYELREKEESRIYIETYGIKKPLFSSYSPEVNYADYFALSFLILTFSTVIAAIWLRKLKSVVQK